jgi:hypothetical protein
MGFDSKKLRAWSETTAAPLTVVQGVYILWSGERLSNHSGNLSKWIAYETPWLFRALRMIVR